MKTLTILITMLLLLLIGACGNERDQVGVVGDNVDLGNVLYSLEGCWPCDPMNPNAPNSCFEAAFNCAAVGTAIGGTRTWYSGGGGGGDGYSTVAKLGTLDQSLAILMRPNGGGGGGSGGTWNLAPASMNKLNSSNTWSIGGYLNANFNNLLGSGFNVGLTCQSSGGSLYVGRSLSSGFGVYGKFEFTLGAMLARDHMVSFGVNICKLPL